MSHQRINQNSSVSIVRGSTSSSISQKSVSNNTVPESNNSIMGLNSETISEASEIKDLANSNSEKNYITVSHRRKLRDPNRRNNLFTNNKDKSLINDKNDKNDKNGRNSIPDNSNKSDELSNSVITSKSSRSDHSLSSNTSEIERYTMRELACNLRDAIVIISGQSILSSDDGTSSLITRTGNGFFIKGHYIICPADLVLINPTYLFKHERIPKYFDVSIRDSSENLMNNFSNDENSIHKSKENGIEVYVDNCLQDTNDEKAIYSREEYPNKLVRMSKILVDVSNVNGCGNSYSYEADIIGIDGAANIAILRISTTSEWNNSNPQLRICHPFLQWGKSRSSSPGDTVMVIGNIVSLETIGFSDDNRSIKSNNLMTSLVAENAVIIGNIADNRYVSSGGQVPGELLLLSNMLSSGSQRGLPVINIDGTVIGMIVNIDHSSTILSHYNIALSEFFMRRPVKALIRSYQDNCVPKHYQGFVEPIVDPLNNYYRFNKSWLGLAGILMTQQDYLTNINLTVQSNSINFSRIPISDYNLSAGPDSKEIVGYRILAIAPPLFQTNITGFPPVGSLIPNLKESPLYGIIYQGDIITHINGCPLGDRKGQISPSLIMWRVCPGNSVTIIYKKQSERFQKKHEITVKTEPYSPFLDFPFYAMFASPLKTLLPTLI